MSTTDPTTSESTSTTPNVPNLPETSDLTNPAIEKFIGGFIVIALIVCTCCLGCIYVSNKCIRSMHISYQNHTSATQSSSKIPVIIPKLMLKKSSNGHTEIVGLNRTSSVFSVTV